MFWLSIAAWSRIFHPYDLVPIIPVPHFPPLQFGADISSPAFSTPAFLMVPIIPVSHFQSPPTDVDV